MSVKDLVDQALGVVRAEIQGEIDEAKVDKFDERIADLRNQFVALLLAAQSGEDEKAEREMKHVKASLSLVLATRGRSVASRVENVAHGALELAKRLVVL